MLIYLDNCCYNRPYDDQSYMRINLETQAVVNGRFCPQSVRNFCPIVAGFNAGTYKVPACVL